MKTILFLMAFLLIPVAATADKPVWVTAEGESLQGEMDTPGEVRQRAKRDAEIKAVEKAVGTFIKAHTLVSNSQLAEDLVYAAVRGKITRQEILSSDWDVKSRNLYRVTLKALVEPIYPEKGEGLNVRLSLSKTELREGDEVQIFYQVNQNAYIYIFSIAADGSVTLLLPNSQKPDHFIKTGTPHQFPPDGSGIRLKALFLPNHPGDAAEERIKIIATRQKEELLPLGFREGVFQVYDARSTGMINDLIKRLTRIEPTDWAEATAVYHLRR